MFRRTIGTAALGLGLLIGPTVAATAACEGDGCSATAKPLNIMQFMREQAASTRVGKPSASTRVAKPQPSPTHVTAKVPRAPHRAIVARKKPVPMPVEAATSFPSRPEQHAPSPAISGPYNPFDSLADATPAETTGAAVAGGSDVQLVDAEELNDIDRKADSGPAPANNTAGGDAGQAHSEQASTSWLRWVWSALGSTFTALATAVHQLVRVIV